MATKREQAYVDVMINGQKANASINEMERAAKVLRRELRGLTPDTQEFISKSAELNKVSAHLNKVKDAAFGLKKEVAGMSKDGGMFGGMFGSMTLANLASGAIQKVGDLAIKFVTSAIEASRALEDSLDKLGDGTGGNIIKFYDLKRAGEAFAETSIYSEEQMNEQMSFLAAQKRTEDQTKKTISAAIKMADVLDMDLATAVKQMDATFEGNVGKLGKLDAGFKNLTEEQLKNGAAIDLVNEKYAAFGAVDTNSDRLINAQNKFNKVLAGTGDNFSKMADSATAAAVALLGYLEVIEGMNVADKREEAISKGQALYEAQIKKHYELILNGNEIEKKVANARMDRERARLKLAMDIAIQDRESMTKLNPRWVAANKTMGAAKEEYLKFINAEILAKKSIIETNVAATGATEITYDNIEAIKAHIAELQLKHDKETLNSKAFIATAKEIKKWQDILNGDKTSIEASKKAAELKKKEVEDLKKWDEKHLKDVEDHNKRLLKIENELLNDEKKNIWDKYQEGLAALDASTLSEKDKDEEKIFLYNKFITDTEAIDQQYLFNKQEVNNVEIEFERATQDAIAKLKEEGMQKGIEFTKQEAEAKKKLYEGLYSNLQSALDIWSRAKEQKSDKEIKTLDKNKEKEIERAQGNQERIDAINKKYDAQKAVLEKEAFDRKKKFDMAAIVLDGIREIAGYWAGYASFGPIGLATAGILTGLAAGRTLANVALVSAQEYAAGLYPVIGEQTGQSYNASYTGSVKTGLYSKPTLGLFGEKGPEIVIDGPTTRNLQMNYPGVVSAIYAARMPQYAKGNYPISEQNQTNSIGLTSDMSRVESLLITLINETKQPKRSYVVLKDINNKQSLLNQIEKAVSK